MFRNKVIVLIRRKFVSDLMLKILLVDSLFRALRRLPHQPRWWQREVLGLSMRKVSKITG